METDKLTYDNKYNGMDILQFTKQKIGLRKDILACIERHMVDMLLKHCRVFVMRFDINFGSAMTPQSNNELFCRFFAHFFKMESRAGYDPRAVTVREVSGNDKVHYHVCLMLDASETNHIENHIKNANEVYNCMFGLPPGTRSGNINNCTVDSHWRYQDNGLIIYRDNQRGLPAANACFKQASYLAKDSQKDAPPGVREVFSSKLKKPLSRNISLVSLLTTGEL